MGIKYFYNFILTDRDIADLSGDILSAVRKSYFTDFSRIRDKITADSEGDSLRYEYCIEKDRSMRWLVKDASDTVLQDVSISDEGRYYINCYRDQKLYKRLLFSKLHTLLKAEYMDENGAVCCMIEPRKIQGGLCLLYSGSHLPEPVVLTVAPEVFDERIAQRVAEEFSDYTAAASTNEGVVWYLSEEQTAHFERFVRQAQEELDSQAEESFVGDDAPLYEKINAKDFNIKRNLSASLDISKAADFGVTEAPSAETTEEPADAPIPESEEELSEAEVEENTPAVQPDKLIMADGAVYSYYGELDADGNRSGYGRTLTDLGRTAYEGMYRSDKRWGKGAYFYKDGTLCYSGDWAENARHGVGVGVSSRDGSMHIGRWVNNKPEGNGVRLTSDGEIKFVCKELSDGTTVLMNYLPDDTVLISRYDADGKKISEKTVSLSDF